MDILVCRYILTPAKRRRICGSASIIKSLFRIGQAIFGRIGKMRVVYVMERFSTRQSAGSPATRRTHTSSACKRLIAEGTSGGRRGRAFYSALTAKHTHARVNVSPECSKVEKRFPTFLRYRASALAGSMARRLRCIAFSGDSRLRSSLASNMTKRIWLPVRFT